MVGGFAINSVNLGSDVKINTFEGNSTQVGSNCGGLGQQSNLIGGKNTQPNSQGNQLGQTTLISQLDLKMVEDRLCRLEALSSHRQQFDSQPISANLSKRI